MNNIQAIRHTLWREWGITSVIVMKANASMEEWHAEEEEALHPIYSCTKSVLSALIGIAIDEGLIGSVTQPLSDFRLADSGNASWSGKVTIEHLLTMTPGFRWPDFDKPYRALRAAADPVRFVLEQPLAHVPGEAFTYNSGASHLLSALISEVTGTTAMLYGKARLFEPLGFSALVWSEKNGISEGGTGMSLRSRDMALFGALYMNKGQWGGRRLLSERWIEASTTMRHKGLLHYKPPIYGGYGYHWWCSPSASNGFADAYFAFGHGGQYIMVMPDQELVVVVRKKVTRRNDAVYSRKVIFEHIVPAFI
ncbi:beta-lactamase family protein [Paenibacillus sp. J5C_2022]|uniref:serine hydrolase domain-containing protein n=1 Tax=Paenibacillus sp. J5C2022 TaxID=2977129 RepID=UPI0021D2E9F0|nr:serine hydrolase [Paenibacillus sp. J5C2022]MCU6707240.1 beta-lactamase family protein [Paenibacillus sp. J5C2022]